jgi:hypothetical protein
MMANVRDPTISLPVDDRLICRARLQIAVADQLHVARFGSMLCGYTGAERDGRDRDRQGNVLHEVYFQCPMPNVRSVRL